MTTKTVAVLTIHEAGKMTKEERKRIAAWLKSQAQQFEKHGDEYCKTRFRARYLYPAK